MASSSCQYGSGCLPSVCSRALSQRLSEAISVLCRFIQYRSDVGTLLHMAPLALCVALPVLPKRRMAWGTGLALASTLGGVLVPATVGAARALISGGCWQFRVSRSCCLPREVGHGCPPSTCHGRSSVCGSSAGCRSQSERSLMPDACQPGLADNALNLNSQAAPQQCSAG